MGVDYGKHAASSLAEALYERMYAVGLSLEARGDLPENAEEFANVVVHTVFDQLAGAMMELNLRTGRHPDDTRPDS